MSQQYITSLLWRSAATVALILSLLTCAAVLARARWPNLSVRVVTSLLLVTGFAASGPAVDALVQSRIESINRSTFGFVCVLPGYLHLWGPAVLGIIAGTLTFYFVSTRAVIGGSGV